MALTAIFMQMVDEVMAQSSSSSTGGSGSSSSSSSSLNFIPVLDEGYLALRLIVAASLGGCIGLERERAAAKKDLHGMAGLRTHILVALSSCLVQILSVHGYASVVGATASRDPARLAAQAVSGVGFLGAGAILREGNNTVHGLTTAATIWISMASGLACGLGYWWGALITTGLALTCLIGVKYVEEQCFRPFRKQGLYLRLINTSQALNDVLAMMEKNDITIVGYRTSYEWKDADPDHEEDPYLAPAVKILNVDLVIRTDLTVLKLLELVRHLHGLEHVETEQVLSADGKPLLPTRVVQPPPTPAPHRGALARAVTNIMAAKRVEAAAGVAPHPTPRSGFYNDAFRQNRSSMAGGPAPSGPTSSSVLADNGGLPPMEREPSVGVVVSPTDNGSHTPFLDMSQMGTSVFSSSETPRGLLATSVELSQIE